MYIYCKKSAKFHKDADGMASSDCVDPDQTERSSHWSGSTQFAKTRQI